MPSLATRPLGSSGIAASIVGLGCNNFGRRADLAATRAVVDAALEEGVTFFDTADIYGRGMSEEYLGEVLQGRRDAVVLATKFGMDMGDGRGPRGSRQYILDAADASLKRLRTEVIDYYWYHRPDGVTPILETLEALHELIKAGKVRAIGASNFDADQLREAAAVAEEHGLTPFTAVQNEYSLLVRDAERDVLPACQELGIAFVPFFPLASGLLTGKYRRGEAAPSGTRLSGRDEIATPEQFDLLEAIQGYADERGAPMIDVAIGALLAHDAVSSVIAGATKPEQVRANAAAGRWAPTEDDLAALSDVLSAHAV
ncbi:MAG TPA: aldo/keto reductase [Solirubrobacteraceae bacterium]|jgi:aryl-alcohol dehydrogenase-like predicted oxidoreductase|nr:aldo/keto reductase [Solirubrobacteraceae bacterium]